MEALDVFVSFVADETAIARAAQARVDVSIANGHGAHVRRPALVAERGVVGIGAERTAL